MGTFVMVHDQSIFILGSAHAASPGRPGDHPRRRQCSGGSRCGTGWPLRRRSCSPCSPRCCCPNPVSPWEEGSTSCHRLRTGKQPHGYRAPLATMTPECARSDASAADPPASSSTIALFAWARSSAPGACSGCAWMPTRSTRPSCLRDSDPPRSTSRPRA
jgi:hypothetical protein